MSVKDYFVKDFSEDADPRLEFVNIEVLDKIKDTVDKKVRGLIEKKLLKQEKEDKVLGGPGTKIVWLIPDANRPVASICSLSKISPYFSRYDGSRRVLGFVGSFEESVQTRQ